MAVEFKTYKPGRRMRIRIIAPTVCEGQDVEPGQELNAVEDDALTLIGANKALALDPGAPGYKQPATGPDSPPVPDGTYGHQRPLDQRPDGSDGERNADGTYADGTIKPKPKKSGLTTGTDDQSKQFYQDAPKEDKNVSQKQPSKPGPIPAPPPGKTNAPPPPPIPKPGEK